MIVVIGLILADMTWCGGRGRTFCLQGDHISYTLYMEWMLYLNIIAVKSCRCYYYVVADIKDSQAMHDVTCG